MGNPGRKMARQLKRTTEEGREQLKQEQTEKQAANPPKAESLHNQTATSHVPQMRVRQRRAGNA